MTATILIGDAPAVLRTLPAASAVACITSPPYWRQRNYLPDGHPLRPLELGHEATPEEWASNLVGVFRDVRRVLTPDGCLWLNVGDKYAAGGLGGGGYADGRKNWKGTVGLTGWRKPPPGYKPKDLSLAPFKLAEALRGDGWYLRQTIIWQKVAAVEPPRLDRPSVSHEYLFLLTVGQDSRVRDPGEPWWLTSVWSIFHGGDGSHVAAMPVELARRCIVSSSARGDTILDSFAGSGTTLLCADRLEREAIGIELIPETADQAERRILADAAFPGMAEVDVRRPEPLPLFGSEAAS